MLAEYDLSALQEHGAGLTEDMGSFIRKLARGETGFPLEKIWQGAKGQIREALGFSLRLGVALLAAMLFQGVQSRMGECGKGAGTVCALSGAGILVGWFGTCAAESARVAEKIRQVTEALGPILTGLLTALGAQNTSAAFLTQAGILQTEAGWLLDEAVPSLYAASAALSVIGNLQETVRLKKMAGMLSGMAGWLCGGILAAFTTLTALSGGLTSVQDGIALRSAQTAVDNLFPVVGGELSGALGAAAGSALVIKQATGVTGIVLIGWMCLEPLIRLGISVVVIRAVTVLAEPAGGGNIIDMAEGTMGAMKGLMAGLAASAVLIWIWLGSAMQAGRAAIAVMS